MHYQILFIIYLISCSTIFAQFESHEDKYNIYAPNIPNKISFANEKVPIEEFDIKERLDKEILINTYWQSKTILLIKKSHKYFPIIEKILQENNIPDDFKYLAVAESGLENVTSPAGAKGVWQFLKKTGLEYGLEINSQIDERYHLEKSTEAACKYLQKAYDEFGSWTMAAASYNMGINGVKRKMQKQGTNNYFNLHLNDETSRYIFRIIVIKEIMENPRKYGFVFRKSDLYNYPEVKQIRVDSTINDLYLFAKKHNVNYKILKKYNPWLRISKLPDESRRVYYIDLPRKSEKLVFDDLVFEESLD